MGTMLYVGARTDAFPLTCPELRKRFSRIVYTDRPPKSGHTSPTTRNAKEILAKLCDQGGRYANLAPDSFVVQPDGGYAATLLDECMFVYYINCDLVSRLPNDLLNDVTTIYMDWFTPCPTLLNSLPSLKFVYATKCCVGPLYWAVIGRSGAMIRKEINGWNPETIIDRFEWDDEAKCFIRWLGFDDEEEGAEPPLILSSDAPVRVKWFSEGTRSAMSD